MTKIWFTDNNGKKYACPAGVDQVRFEKYLERTSMPGVGRFPLKKQLKRVASFGDIQPGDVLIKGGSPGHAVMVMDVAVNKAGEKIYLLAQSYNAGPKHSYLKNPMDGTSSPWYKAGNEQVIETPEWSFTQQQLRRW